MKRKPSKRKNHQRDQKALLHIVKNGGIYHYGYAGITTFGTVAPNQSAYVVQPMQIKAGDTIMIDSDAGFGDRIYYGRNTRKMHPARRHKEKNKWCYEAVMSTDSGGTCVVRKISDSFWVVQGTHGTTI